MDAERTPVIVGVGELAERGVDPAIAREPAALIAAALRIAERDAGFAVMEALDGLDVINCISWPYPDLAAAVAERTGAQTAERTYHPVGGQTPLLAIHQAAMAIQSGRWQLAAVCGGEAQASVTAAQRQGIRLNWTAPLLDFEPVRGAAYQQPMARTLDFATPAHVYPFYESATRAAWGQTLAEAEAESAAIWASNARIAAGREAAWIAHAPDAAEIATSTADNRLIAWPYTKLMTANPNVNQAAAVIVCSLALARAWGVAESRIVHVHGGAAAEEPRDYLTRQSYSTAPAMEWVLDRAAGLAGDGGFDLIELYSCFPVVPKMARRTLGLPADAAMSVAGGLTFFGAPLNNYMTHAAVAMVERLRAAGGTGLLFGQGEYVTKHHALVLGSTPAGALAADWRRPDDAAPMVPVVTAGAGPARAEAATVLFDRAGRVRHGGVIARLPTGARLLARVPATDGVTIAAILSERGVVGMFGVAAPAADGVAEWTVG